MELKPVAHSRPPAYPTRREVLAGAASLALINLIGHIVVCAEDPAGGILAAPIFEHGEGRGATGCVVIVPPVFLSEEEALKVVKEELANHGVQLAPGAVLKELFIAPRCMQQVETGETNQETVQEDERAALLRWMKMDDKSRKIVEDTEHAAPLRLTGMDEKRSIAVVFICRRNYKAFGGVDPHNTDVLDRDGKNRWTVMATASSYNLKDAAQYVATEIHEVDKTQRRLYVGVFYDPLARGGAERRRDPFENTEDATSVREIATAESKQLLRKQAQDFVAWLKQQGAM